MKLSEAIRLGSMSYGNCRGTMIVYDDAPVAACAIGAAMLAVGEGTEPIGRIYPRRTFPILNRKVKVPELKIDDVDLAVAIYWMNDVLSWSRERIADWVETVEAAVEEEARDEVRV